MECRHVLLHAGSFLFAEVKMLFFAAVGRATLVQPRCVKRC